MADTDKAPINIGQLFKRIWRYKYVYIIVLPIVLVGTYWIMCQIPRYYTSGIALAPESSGGTSGSLSSLASSFGLGSLSKLKGNEDAINAEMYPDLFESNDFLLSLMSVNVSKQDSSYKGTYYEYLETCIKGAPWDNWLGELKQKYGEMPVDKRKTKPAQLDIFNLTYKQYGIFESVKGNIKCNVDKKTGVISISVKDQDPLVAATIANECSRKLQDFMIAYRTNKARIDYNYYKDLCDEARAEYDSERQKYAGMSDADMDVILPSVTQELEEQENVMQLAYDKYTAMYQQMQMAQAKLQEATPVITVIQSASVAVKPAGPKRMYASIGAAAFAFFLISLIAIGSGDKKKAPGKKPRCFESRVNEEANEDECVEEERSEDVPYTFEDSETAGTEGQQADGQGSPDKADGQ